MVMGRCWSTCKNVASPILFAAILLWEEILFWKPVHKVVDIWPDGAAHTTQGRYYIHGKKSKRAKDIKSISNRETGGYQICGVKNYFQTEIPPPLFLRLQPKVE